MECTLLTPAVAHQQAAAATTTTTETQMTNSLVFLTSKLNLKPKTLFTKPLLFHHHFSTISKHLQTPKTQQQLLKSPKTKPKPQKKPIITKKEKTQIIRQKWLSSLSYNNNNNNSNNNNNGFNANKDEINCKSKLVIGIDPDVSGALSVIRTDHSGVVSAQVFDSPWVEVAIGNRVRKRLDASSIVQLVQRLDAPPGTVAYLEQSISLPMDGKQSWWSGGFGFGLWVGTLVTSGFTVVPVPSSLWKKKFDLARAGSSKDDSRELARKLFPDLTPMFKRKMDHGRAEALLIAAYGNGHKIKTDMVGKLDEDDCEAASETEINETDGLLAICK